MPWANTAVPGVITLPVIAGTAVIGTTVTCSTGQWSGDPTAYEYRWNRSNAPIAGATAATYTVSAADRTHTLTCTVTAENAGGEIQAQSAGVRVVAAAAPACPPASGAVAGARLGPLALGETRAQARRRLPRYTAGGAVDRFCVAGGAAIAAAYTGTPTDTASIARAGRPPAGDRIMVVLTANRRYHLDGVRPGARLGARAIRRLGAGAPLRIGAARWYVFADGTVRGVVEARGGVVRAIGVATRAATRTRAAQRQLLSRL